MSKARRPSLFDVLARPEATVLTAAEKLLLIYLAWRQGQNVDAWPSLQTIGRDLHLRRKTCLRAISRLVEAGAIVKTAGACGRGHSNRYTIPLAEKDSPRHLLGQNKRTPGDTGKGLLATPEKDSPGVLNYQKNNHLNNNARAREDFDLAWSLYPKHIGRQKAWLLWQELAPSPELVAQILASIAEHTASEQWAHSLGENGGRFVPKFANFLRDRGWEDELPAPPESDGCSDMDPDEAAAMIARVFAVDGG